MQKKATTKQIILLLNWKYAWLEIWFIWLKAIVESLASTVTKATGMVTELQKVHPIPKKAPNTAPDITI